MPIILTVDGVQKDVSTLGLILCYTPYLTAIWKRFDKDLVENFLPRDDMTQSLC